MDLLAHRGHWTDSADKNTAKAFHAAFARGYGVETDIRDLGGELVISHDAPVNPELTAAKFLDIYTSYPTRPVLALNIKADGLAAPLKALLTRYGVTNYFVFDMSVPDTLGYLAQGMTVFTRRSEYEPGSVLDARADGLWLDWFSEGHVDAGLITREMASGRRVAVVSPELHKRSYEAAWAMWREAGVATAKGPGRFMLCSDLCDEAAAYFGAGQ